MAVHAALRISGVEITRESDGADMVACAVTDARSGAVIDIRVVDRGAIDVCDNCGGLVVDGQDRAGGVYCDGCTD
jgi:hypothetical protein